MNTNYDVMILGTGEAGIYAAYELALKCPSARVLVVDKGLGAAAALPAEQGERRDPQSSAQVQQGGHHGWAHIPQQQLG